MDRPEASDGGEPGGPEGLARLAELLPVGVLVLDRDGRLLSANTAVRQTLGLSAEAMAARLASTREDHTPDGDLWPALAALARCSGQACCRLATAGPPGSERRLRLTSAAVPGEELCVVTVEDVTETEALASRERDMLQSMHALQAERSEALVQLSQSVAHQILNPIMAIAGFSRRLLERGRLDEPGLERLAAIRDESGRLEAIVRALADYAAIRPGPRRLVPSTHIVRAVDRLLAAKAAAAGKEYRLDVTGDTDDHSLWIEPALLDMALDALVQNAVDFSLPGLVDVTLHLEGSPSAWTVTIADSGQGIAPDTLPFVFDPFFTTKARGLGMGLPRAKRAMLEHQGEITLTGAPGHGATATLTIPQRARPDNPNGRRA